MTDENAHDLAPEDPGGGLGPSLRKGRQAFRKINRALSDDDLAIPAVQRIVLDELDRLEMENDEFKSYRQQFHEADKKVAVLEEKSKTTLAMESISVATLTIGAAALGSAPVFWKSQPSGYIILAFGLVLIFGGIFAKWVKR